MSGHTLLWMVNTAIWVICFVMSPTLPEFSCVIMSSLLAWKSYMDVKS